MSVTTTASFTIPAVSSSVSVSVTDTSQTPQNSVVTVYDGTHAAVMQVASISTGTSFSLTTLELLAGSAGNTMASGAYVTFASAPLSSLPSHASPTGTDLLYVVSGGQSYQSTITEVLAAGGGSSNNFDTFMESFTGISHYYPCNETTGTTVTDTVGSSNGTYENTSNLVLAAQPLTYDNEPCPYLSNSSSGTGSTSYIEIPDTTTSATAFSIMCVYEISHAQPNTLYTIFSTRDSSNNGFLWYLYQATLQGTFAGSTGGGMSSSGFPTRALYGVSFKTTGGSGYGLMSFYVNGMFCFQINAPGAGYVKSTNGYIYFGWDIPNSYYGSGLFGKIAVAASTCWTQAQWLQIANAWRALP
jgi:hypothetical protein